MNAPSADISTSPEGDVYKNSSPPKTRSTHTARPTEPIDPLDVPATVHDLSKHRMKIAAVTHPDGPGHPNARATVARLEKRGFTIVTLPAATSPATISTLHRQEPSLP